MEQQGVEHATVVINNTAGVCDKAQNCADVVGHIPPYGASLIVYYPGGKKNLWEQDQNDAESPGKRTAVSGKPKRGR